MTAGVRAPDAIVVGAGVVGAACAWALAEEGLRVHVLEAGFAGCGTTGAAMGHIVVMDDSEAQFALTAYGRRLWDELAPELPPECEFERCGTLWAAEDEAQLAAVRARQAFYVARRVAAAEGASVAAALLGAGVAAFRVSVMGDPRGPLCGMGCCHECRVSIGGVAHRRACLEPAADGLCVSTGAAGPVRRAGVVRRRGRGCRARLPAHRRAAGSAARGGRRRAHARDGCT